MTAEDAFKEMVDGNVITFTDEGKAWLDQDRENPISQEKWNIIAVTCNDTVTIVSDMHRVEEGMMLIWILPLPTERSAKNVL